MAKFWAHGTSVSFGGTDIGGVTSIGLPDQSRGEVDITDADSSGVMELLPGLVDNGSIELEMRYDPDDAGQQALEAGIAGSVTSPSSTVITLPSAAAATSPVTLTFDAFVSALGGDLPQTSDDAPSRTATLRISGNITISLGT